MNTSNRAGAVVVTSFAASLVCVSAQSVVAPDASLEKLSSDFSFTEGPTCDAGGNIFFTDQNNNRIMEWSVDGVLSTFLQPSGRANGMYMDAKGNLIACADEKPSFGPLRRTKR
jgi:gluconolactonase